MHATLLRLKTLQVNLGYRCNLTVLPEPRQEDTDRILASHQVEVVASLPCYRMDNLDHQGIQDANHGYGCTAGQGSSSGALN
jgi:hypothetical protein